MMLHNRDVRDIWVMMTVSILDKSPLLRMDRHDWLPICAMRNSV